RGVSTFAQAGIVKAVHFVLARENLIADGISTGLQRFGNGVRMAYKKVPHLLFVFLVQNGASHVQKLTPTCQAGPHAVEYLDLGAPQLGQIVWLSTHFYIGMTPD